VLVLNCLSFVYRSTLKVIYIYRLNSVARVRERTIPTERQALVAKLVPTFADRGCHVVSVKYSNGVFSVF
jgi:hypothetical protein